MIKTKSDILIKNKKARFDYELMDFYTCGIVLTGTEIKSIRLGKVSLKDSFCIIDNNELWAKNIMINEYSFGSYNNHIPRRDRKLLVTKKELKKIIRLTRETGYTIVPTKMFINAKGYAKIEIAIAKGKKEYDKRNAIKERESKRDLSKYFMK